MGMRARVHTHTHRHACVEALDGMKKGGIGRCVNQLVLILPGLAGH